MKQFKIALLFFTIIFCSCSKDYLFNRDQTKISRELKLIIASDQTVRHSLIFLDEKFKIKDFYSVSDSLSNSENPKGKVDFSKIPSKKEQINKFPEKTKEEYNSYHEMFCKTGFYVDSINADNVYKLIKEYGYPCYDNRKWENPDLRVGITTVLTHIDSNSKLGKKMLKIMVKEYLKGRVSDGAMKHYLWDVDGRNGRPYEYVIDIEKWKKRANGK